MGSKIVIFGSFVADLMGRAPSLPHEGETVMGSFFKIGAGGKGFNQGIAAHRLNADVTLITRVGNDTFAQIALATMREDGLTTDHVIVSDTEETGVALILVDEITSQNKILVIPGACGAFTLEDVERLRPVLEQAAYLLVQLEINIDATCRAVAIAHAAGTRVIMNPAPATPIPDKLLNMVDIITPNEVEAELLTGVTVDSPRNCSTAAAYFHARGVKSVVITLGRRGAFISHDEQERLVPAFNVAAVDTTGAGDAFNGGLVVALSEGRDIWEATIFGSAVAALSIQKIGTTPSMPRRSEVEDFLRKQG